MTETRTTSQLAVDRFWDQFVERARKNGVKETALRWYVMRAEQYLKAFPDKRLAKHSPEDVAGYLEETGRIDRILDWQFVQIVDAIQNLLLTAGTLAADQVNRDYSRVWLVPWRRIIRRSHKKGDHRAMSRSQMQGSKRNAFHYHQIVVWDGQDR